MEINEIISSGLLELYTAGLTNPEETIQVEEWLLKFPELQTEFIAIQESMEAYAMEQAIIPSAAVKQNILKSIELPDSGKLVAMTPANAPGKKSTGNVFWKRLAAASVILLAGSIVFNFTQYHKNSTLSASLQVAQNDLIALRDETDNMKADLHVVQSKYSMPVSLHGMEVAPDAAAKIFWMQNSGEVYIDPSNLPDAPQGKFFQLWAIVDGKPVDAGMILTTKKGDKYRIQKMKSFGKAQAFAVTLENEIGNAVPKGPMYVKGSM